MIGFLHGFLMVKKPPFLLVDVAGVGYELQASMNTFYHLPPVGAAVSLYTHLIVREDAQLLYGFYNEQERAVFREIIKISGVGPKLALVVLSGMTINELFACVQARNHPQLVKIPGIGKKTAERLIIEMHDKFAKRILNNEQFSEVVLTASSVQSPERIVQDAIDALIALGYKAQEANNAVMRVVDDSADSETLIRLALQNLGK
jgi:Holliday junction DNA helicase RuvA